MKRLLKLLPFISIAPFILMGATNCNEQLRTVLAQTCDGLDIAYEHYDALVDGGVISASRQEKVAVVRKQTDALCADPSHATTVSVTAIAARAYVQLNAAFREGGDLKAAKLGYQQTEKLRGLLERAKK